MVGLDQRLDVELHVVAKIIEAELVIRTVGYVAGVGLFTFDVVHIVLDNTDRQAEELVDLAHPLSVACCEIIVDRNDVNAASGEAVKIRGKRGYKRFTFTRTHLGDTALVQGDAADHLHVKVPHAGRTL